MSAHHTPFTSRIQRRFERWELQHLRTLAAEQAERIERLERDAYDAAYMEDFWRDRYQDLSQHLDDGTADARCVGLTQQGDLMVVQMGGAA